MLSSGSLLDNRYRLDERIATGGMGDVWRGTDVVLGRTIAVKIASHDGVVVNVQPEYDDVARAAAALGRPVADVLDDAVAATRSLLEGRR